MGMIDSKLYRNKQVQSEKDQPTNKPTNQPINKPTDQGVHRDDTLQTKL